MGFLTIVLLHLPDCAKLLRFGPKQKGVFSSCIPFVGGSCCSNLRKQISQSKKCLCLLVADRNYPDHGFKVNALILLSICHAPSNASECPELLHLPPSPNSTEAEFFEQFAAENTSNSSSVQGKSTSGSNRLKEGVIGGWKVGKILTWQLVSIYIIVHILTEA